MQIGEILNRLYKARRIREGEYMATCPAHSDKKFSLHLTLADSKILMKCHAGCTIEQIVDALGIDMTDLFIDNLLESKQKIVATYDYEDEVGKLLYQVVRYEPKDFRQRRPDGKGNWIWNLNGARRVLYHLPTLKEVTTDTVYFVEGEKDADALCERGLIATTSAQGANGWKPEYAEFLTGLRVTIIPDKDIAGCNYALDVIHSLQGIASEIKVLILPGDDINDVSDWLDKGNDHTQLESMAQSTDKLEEYLTSLTSLTSNQLSDNPDTTDATDTTDTTDTTDATDTTEKTNIVDKINNDRKGRLIWRLVDEWLELHSGEKFDLDLICKQLEIKTRDDRHSVVKKLSYETNRESLEKSDRLYRYINNSFKYINWVNANITETIDLKYPYGLDDNSQFGFDGRITISPGDVICIAGVSNMGKTCFCQNLLWLNMDDFPCTLMGNEYTPAKFKRRVSHMTWRNPIKEDGTPKFELIERRENWKDIIRPDNINIIDWINLSDNFYQIGKIIEGIQSKLNKGIAVIALQKDEAKKRGLGGHFSEDLSSLYLTIDFGRLTIIKAKEWHEFNPNNKIYGFDIVNYGTQFHRIRQIKKCNHCWGSGTYRGSRCEECEGTGYIDMDEVF